MPVAQVKQITHFQLILELSPNELDLLKAMVQNPLRDAESVEESQLRRAIFNACHNQRT